MYLKNVLKNYTHSVILFFFSNNSLDSTQFQKPFQVDQHEFKVKLGIQLEHSQKRKGSITTLLTIYFLLISVIFVV